MKFKFPEFVRVSFLVLAVCVLCGQGVAENKPWPLRDHYSFAGESITFRVDAKTAEWNAITSSGADLIGLGHTEIELADGRVARLAESNWVTDGRDTFRDGFGDGMRFRSEFKPLDGVHVEYHVNRYNNHAFLTIMVIVRNTSGQPLGLKAIRLGVMEEGQVHPGDIMALMSNQAARRGTHLVPARDDRVSLARLKPLDGSGVLGLGLLQSGFMKSSVRFAQGPKGWGGVIESVYNPPIMIAPKKTAQSDALWVMSAGRGAKPLKDFHGWAEGFIMPRMVPKRYPKAWVTVPRGSTSGDLLRAVDQVRIKSVTHALVPGGLVVGDGDLPLDKLPGAIKRKGMAPGLTVDPLMAPRSSKGMTIPGSDGRHWVDLRLPEAREYGVANLRRFVKWKYEFFAIEESGIPDDVLREMNITRSVADVVAFELMDAAAGELPVMPSSQLSLGNDEEGWSRVVETTRENAKYQVLTGPTRLDLSGISLLNQNVLDLIKETESPIEIVGLPSKEVREQLNQAIRFGKSADE